MMTEQEEKRLKFLMLRQKRLRKQVHILLNRMGYIDLEIREMLDIPLSVRDYEEAGM